MAPVSAAQRDPFFTSVHQSLPELNNIMKDLVLYPIAFAHQTSLLHFHPLRVTFSKEDLKKAKMLLTAKYVAHSDRPSIPFPRHYVSALYVIELGAKIFYHEGRILVLKTIASIPSLEPIIIMLGLTNQHRL